MKLSVVIPVYKVEAYLDFCLKSVVRQGVDDCEIILVDDASPDGSGALCDTWARKNPRFRVIHCTENRGLSVARNNGLDAATGEYVTFVDSDDYISPHALQANMDLLARYPEADVVEYPVCVYHGTPEAYRYTPGACEITDYAGWVHGRGYVHCYAWNKIYRLSLWNGLRFPEGKWYEDIFTVPSALRRARYILRSDKGLYFYRGREGSISNTLCDKGIKDLFQSNFLLYRLLKNETDLNDTDLDEVYLRLCDHQIVWMQHGGGLCVPERKIPLRRALFARRPLNYRVKAILKALCGKRYCAVVARTREVLRR